MLRPYFPLLLSALAGSAFASLLPSRRACTVIFDGRIPPETQPADFDAETSVYDNGFVKGENLTWAEIIKFPDVAPSLFDVPVGAKPFEITISDDSIFVPGAGSSPGVPQGGWRRAEVIPAINNGTDVTVQGKTTIHWSLRTDPTKPLNLTFEHQLVWHENLTFTSSQFKLKAGAPFNQTFIESEHKTLRLEGKRTAEDGSQINDVVFSTAFDEDVWHNFAVTLDWFANSGGTLTVYYSKNTEPLQQVNTTSNDNSGGGQQHFGIRRLPLGDAGIDVQHEGFQGTGVDEGLFYGGILIEDSADGCITTS